MSLAFWDNYAESIRRLGFVERARPMSSNGTIWIEQEAFAKAVEAVLIAGCQGRDASTEGLRVVLHPTPFRMALEVRDALSRATGMDVQVQGWLDLIAPMKPPFPGIVAPTERDDAAGTG